MKHICSSETVFHLCGITLYFNNLLNIKIKNDTFNWEKSWQMIFLRHMHCMSFHWCYPLSSRYRVVSMGLHGNTKCWNETPILWYEYWRFQAFFPSEKNKLFPKAVCTLPRLNIALFGKYRSPSGFHFICSDSHWLWFLCLVNVEDISFAPLSIISAAVIVLSIVV